MDSNDIFKPSARKASIQTDLVPLINIVFLLLIFFLVAGKALSPSQKDFERPEAFMGYQIPEDALLISLTKDGMIEIDGHALTKKQVNGLAGKFDKIFKEDPQRQVLISADARIPAHYLTKMLGKVSLAGAVNVAIATQKSGGGGN